jgi:hypothetical protein
MGKTHRAVSLSATCHTMHANVESAYEHSFQYSDQRFHGAMVRKACK